MDPFLFIVLRTASHELFAVRGREKYRTVDVTKVAFFHVILLDLRLLHGGFVRMFTNFNNFVTFSNTFSIDRIIKSLSF